jgi:hypothetical protein
VPLDSGIYRILDLAEARGLCSPLPASKPYTRARVLAAIEEILDHTVAVTDGWGGARQGLTRSERLIVESERDKYKDRTEGLDKRNGQYRMEADIPDTDVPVSLEAGAGADVEFSQVPIASTPDGASEYRWGGDLWLSAYLRGDIGRHFSYGFLGAGGLFQAPRVPQGEYNTYYEDFMSDAEDEGYINREISTYEEPAAYFPFSYRKRWDGSVFYLDQLSADGFQSWPDQLAGGYALNSEIAASFMDERLFFRIGRLSREWGSMAGSGSLVLGGSARPFLAVEGRFQPANWFAASALTGQLEYFNSDGIKASSWTNQNAYSLGMLEFNLFKNRLRIEAGEAVVWPKRFEMGYPLPTVNSFFYQNNVGDFDNLSMFMSVKGNLPGLGRAWFTFYDDESEIKTGMWGLDRTMTAFQAGASVDIRFLPFTSAKLTYTKIEPYTYTHNRVYVPWSSGAGEPMETAYVNNGVGLGYYLPPNSDEMLMRFDTVLDVFGKATNVHFQYQMIRHGADFGDSAVDGSSYQSELDPEERDTNPVLTKFFLHDGAYQWFHIFKAGGEYVFNKLPLAVYAEAGVVFSYFTDIDGEPNSGEAYPYHTVLEGPYTQANKLILTLGLRLFPDN